MFCKCHQHAARELLVGMMGLASQIFAFICIALWEKIMYDALVQAIGKARLWENELLNTDIDLEEFCRQKKLTEKYVLKVLRLNTLSPNIKSAIMNGTHPKTQVLKDLLKKTVSIILE